MRAEGAGRDGAARARGEGDAGAADAELGPRALPLSLPWTGGWGRTGARAGPGAAVTGLRWRRARVYLRRRSSGRWERPRAPARPQQQVAVTAAAAARELKPAAAGGGGLRAGGRRREEGAEAERAAAGGGGARSRQQRGRGPRSGGGGSSRVARDGEIPCHPDVSVMLAQTLRDLAAAKQQRQQEEEEQRQPLARL